MNFKPIFLRAIIFVALILAGSSAIFAQEKLVEYETYKLDNGLTVILSEDHTQQKVFGVVVVNAGGKDDPADATGMAHYQEHMLFKGTTELGTTDWEAEKPHIDRIFELYDQLGQTTDEAKRKEIQAEINKESLEANKYAIPNELSNVIKDMGGTGMNAGTGTDQTIFYNAFPPNEINRWLELYSHRFISPVFRGFQAELEVVYEEKNMYEDMFFTKLLETFNYSFYKNHPYGQQTLIGTTEDLKNPSLSKMYEFFTTWYVANNMALVLVGDFDSEKIKPIIAEKFGRLKTGELPERKVYEEKPFNGREFVEGKYSPVKLGILGFRSVPAGHPDEIKLEIANKILSNQSKTGLLDQLVLDNELLEAMAINMTQNDHGASIFFIIPKLIGQKLETAEELTLAQIEKLKKGEFSDEVFEAIKLNTYKDFVWQFEQLEGKALTFAYLFSRGQEVDEYLNQPQVIEAITKQDIIDIANKYYGENYLAFYSKMGLPKKNKIEKPGYEPLVTNTNKKSAFTKRFEKMKTQKPQIKYVDFNKDFETITLANKNRLFVTKNNQNQIFTLTMKVGVGTHKEPMLEYASQLMNYSGTESKDLKELKKEFSKLGTSYSISSNEHYISISLDGLEKNFEKSLILLNELLTKAKLDPKKIDILVEGAKSARKMEKSEPASVADALFEYMKYGEKSEYIDRLTIKQIKKLDTDELVKTFQNSLAYETEFHYVGQKTSAEVEKMLDKHLKFSDKPTKTESPIEHKINEYTENTVLFVNKPKALQSKIYFMINGKPYDLDEKPTIEAFNQYFGGGFSGLVLQEIREYRSMAYGAGAFYRTPLKEGRKTIFYGYIATQADKTVGAIDIFHDLVRDMPQKTERTEMIKQYLQQSALTATPTFRQLSQSAATWQMQGYNDDPRKAKMKSYESLSFEDINAFHEQNIKSKPMVIAIVGSKKSIDMDALEKYGKIVEIKEKNLFKD